MLNQLCGPALIYFVFAISQVIIDTGRGMYNTAMVKFMVAILFTILLNHLCSIGLGIISWFIVFIPFILMTLIISILLYVFGLDPSSGKINIHTPLHHHQKPYPDPRSQWYHLDDMETSPSDTASKITNQRLPKQSVLDQSLLHKYMDTHNIPIPNDVSSVYHKIADDLTLKQMEDEVRQERQTQQNHIQT